MISVCYVVDAPFLGGAELYVSRLASGLDRHRFRASVLMRANRSDPRLAQWAGELRSRDIEVIDVPMRLPFRPLDAVSIWRALERSTPTIVHVNMPGPYDGQIALIVPLARLAGARTVVTEHLPMVGRLWKRAWVKAAAYSHLDLAVTMTEANARFLVERQGVPADRVRVVPNGVPRRFGLAARRDTERERLGILGHEAALLYVGNILVHKGLYRLLESMSRLDPPARDTVRLLVVGSGPDEVRCRERAAALGLTDKISFLGQRPADDVESIMAACDLLVLPSEIEGLPYVVLEAMAAGRPVVAGRVFGLPEAVLHGVTGLLVDPDSVDEIGAAVQRLAGDSALRLSMGRAARERFEARFTLEAQVARMEAIYESLARGDARRGSPS